LGINQNKAMMQQTPVTKILLSLILVASGINIVQSIIQFKKLDDISIRMGWLERNMNLIQLESNRGDGCTAPVPTVPMESE
jgi:hypothetical protein